VPRRAPTTTNLLQEQELLQSTVEAVLFVAARPGNGNNKYRRFHKNALQQRRFDSFTVVASHQQ
jgi:hypothetical protein